MSTSPSSVTRSRYHLTRRKPLRPAIAHDGARGWAGGQPTRPWRGAACDGPSTKRRIPAVLQIRQLTPADARRVPWKNGRGVTDELALWPPGASFERGDFDWRIACAGVDAAGPFSAFPGF